MRAEHGGALGREQLPASAEVTSCVAVRAVLRPPQGLELMQRRSCLILPPSWSCCRPGAREALRTHVTGYSETAATQVMPRWLEDPRWRKVLGYRLSMRLRP